MFPDESTAERWFTSMRWPHGLVCRVPVSQRAVRLSPPSGSVWDCLNTSAKR